MGKDRDRWTVSWDEDLAERMQDEVDQTNKSKSQVANELVRDGLNAPALRQKIAHLEVEIDDQHSLEDSFLPAFGQGLFVAGFILPFFVSLWLGWGVAMIGLAVLLGSKVDYHMSNGATGLTEAFRRAVGI